MRIVKAEERKLHAPLLEVDAVFWTCTVMKFAKLVWELQQEVTTLWARIEEEVNRTEAVELRVEDLGMALYKHQEMDRLAFFIMNKLFKESGEAQTKAHLYDAEVKVAIADGALWVTSLVQRYATLVEGFYAHESIR